MGQHDRAFIADGVFAYFRRRRSLEALAQTERPMRLALAVLVRELGIGMREWDGVIGADDALWLREFKSRLATSLPAAVAADLPDWLWERLGAAYGDAERAALAHAWLASRAARPAHQSAEDDARRGARGARGVGHRCAADALFAARPARRRAAVARAASAVRCRRARSAGRRQPARRLSWSRRSARRWSWISAPARAARRCCWAR